MPPLRTMSRNEKGQAWGAFWRLERIWNSNLPIAIKVCLYKCTVLSFLLYGSETWTLTESPCDKLNTFQRSCLRVMLGISRRDNVTNQSVYSQTQARPLSSEVKRQLRFPGHSLRRDKEDLINRFALYVPSVGRSVGGTKRLFLQHISRVITGGSIALTEREIRHATEDRDYWSHLLAPRRDNPNWPADELIYTEPYKALHNRT